MKLQVEIRYGEQINKYSMKKLMDEYDAVIVAAGTPKSRELEIKGFRTEGIFPAMKYMEMVNADQKVRHHLGQMYVENGEAVIVGGGSIAIDVARVALRQGATKVTVVSSEKGEKLPAHQWEIDEAKEEGKFYMDINHEVTKDIKADFVILAIGNLAEGYWKEFKEEGNTMSCFSLNAKNPECRTTTFLCIVPYKTLETLDMSLEEVFEWWIHHSKQGPKYMKNAKLLSPKKGWRLVGTKYQQKNYAPGAFVIGDACSGPEGDHFYGIPPSMWGGRTAAYLIQEMYEQNDFSEAKFATFYDKMCDMLNSEYDFYETTRKIMKSDPMLPMIKEFTQFAKAQPGYPNVGYGQMTVSYLKEVHGISYPKRDSKISIGQ